MNSRRVHSRSSIASSPFLYAAQPGENRLKSGIRISFIDQAVAVPGYAIVRQVQQLRRGTTSLQRGNDRWARRRKG